MTADTPATPMIGIAGWKKSGKTTLVARLVAELTRRGLRIATVKHAHHSFEVDDAETDSARHRRAGASQVAVVSSKRCAVITELRDSPEPTFAEVTAWLAPCDLIIVEGYKKEPIPKIEARRAAAPTKQPLADGDSHVVAIAADHPVENSKVPVFSLDDTVAIADFILRVTGARVRTPAATAAT